MVDWWHHSGRLCKRRDFLQILWDSVVEGFQGQVAGRRSRRRRRRRSSWGHASSPGLVVWCVMWQRVCNRANVNATHFRRGRGRKAQEGRGPRGSPTWRHPPVSAAN